LKLPSILGATHKIEETKFMGTVIHEAEKETKTGIGLNIGGGLDFKINNQTIINAEMKYRAGHYSRVIIGAGIVFKF
jgi:opacity protein-like surface antigen